MCATSLKTLHSGKNFNSLVIYAAATKHLFPFSKQGFETCKLWTEKGYSNKKKNRLISPPSPQLWYTISKTSLMKLVIVPSSLFCALNTLFRFKNQKVSLWLCGWT